MSNSSSPEPCVLKSILLVRKNERHCQRLPPQIQSAASTLKKSELTSKEMPATRLQSLAPGQADPQKA